MDHIETVKLARRYESLAYVLLLFAFGLLGLIFGVWQVLIPDLTRALRLTPGSLGLALSIGLAASLPAMIIGGRVTDRLGAQAVIIGSGLVLGLAFGAIAFVSLYAVSIAILLVFYASTGIYDVGINAAAMAYEGLTGRRVMAYLHAAYSGGGAMGAILAGGLVAAGAPFRAIYVGIAVIICALLLAFAFGGLPSSDSRTAGVSTERGNLYRNPAIMLVATIVALAFLAGAAITNWSALYLRTALALPALLGSSSVAIAHIAMVIGRLMSAQVVARWGRRRTILAAGLLSASGMALALATTNVALILLGFLIAGLMIAAVSPVAFSLAGDLAPGQAGQASAVITTVGYAGLLVGPSLIGGLAELVGLRVGLTAVIAVALIIAALSLRVPKADHRR